MRSLTNGASGLKAVQTKMDVAANNIANVNTTAYKESRAKYAEQVQRLTAGPAAANVWNVHNSVEQVVGNGAVVSQIDRDFSSGGNIPTGRNLDLAIAGDGYLAVELPNGETGYTRDGSLNLDEDGILVTKQGYRLLPVIQVTGHSQEMLIEPNGDIRVPGQGDRVGKIHLFKFKNDVGLAARGENIFSATNASGSPEEGLPGNEGYGLLHQGNLELSNVDLINQMTGLMEAQRAYQVNARSVRTSDEIWGMAVNLRK